MPSTHFAKQPRTFCRQLLPVATMMTLIRRHGRMMTTGKLEKTLARVSEIVRMLNLHWQNKKKYASNFLFWQFVCASRTCEFCAMEERKKNMKLQCEIGTFRPHQKTAHHVLRSTVETFSFPHTSLLCSVCDLGSKLSWKREGDNAHHTHVRKREESDENFNKFFRNNSRAHFSCFDASLFCFAYTFSLSPPDMTKEGSQKKVSIIWKIYSAGFEILCLVLMCISCCSKLLFYLLAYDEFLASIKSFTTCFHVASVDEQPENNISSKVEEFTRKKSLPQIFLTHSQSESKLVAAANMSTPFRHTHRHRLTSISIPVADFTEPLSNSSYPPARRMSMMPSVSYGVFNPPIRVQTANEMRQARVNRQASTRSQRVTATLANPSSSSTSNLLRSRSLAALHTHSHMRHSPNCKLRRIADD